MANQTNNFLILDHSGGFPSGIGPRTISSADDILFGGFNTFAFTSAVPIDFDGGLTLAAAKAVVGDGALTATATSGDLLLNTVTSGDVVLDPAGDAYVKLAGTASTDFFRVEDSAAALVFQINADGTGTIGKTSATLTAAGHLTVSGNLTVSGATTTVTSDTLLVSDNLIVVNSGPGASRDAGYLVSRFQSDVNDGTGDVAADTAAEAGTAQAGAASAITLAAGASAVNDYYKNWWIRITNDSPVGIQDEVRKIVGYNGTTKVATVSTAWDAGSPTASTTYALLDRPFMGVIYDESVDEWGFVSTASDPGVSAVTITDYIKVHVGGLQVDDAATMSGAVQFNSTLTVGVNDTGYDVQLFGATAGAYMLWDESANNLILAGAAGFSFGTGVVADDILDEDDMASNSATAMATQQSIKAYVDAQSSSSALAFNGDEGVGALSINLSTEALAITASGSGLTTAGSGNAVDVTLDASNSVQTAWTGASHSVDTAGAISLDSTADASNFTLSANSANPAPLVIAASNAGAGSGSLDFDADGAVTIDAGAGMSLDAGAASNFTTSAGALTLSGAGGVTVTSTAGALLLDGSGQMATLNSAALDINASGAMTLDVVGGMDIVSTQDAADSIYLRANGGVSETIRIHSDQGTGANSLVLLSDAGGIDIDATAGPIDMLAGTTLSLKGAGGASLGDDVGTWEFDGAGAVSETGMTTFSLTPSGAADLDAGGALTIDSASTIGIGTDAVSQAINIGTGGTRTVTVGTSTSTLALESTGGASTYKVVDNSPSAFKFMEGANKLLTITTENATESVQSNIFLEWVAGAGLRLSSGAALTINYMVCLDSTGRLVHCDANADATSRVLGSVLDSAAGAAEASKRVATEGVVKLEFDGTAIVDGDRSAPVYLSATTAGKVSIDVPSGSGDSIVRVGWLQTRNSGTQGLVVMDKRFIGKIG